MNTSTRPPLHMTALQAANRTFNWVNTRPDTKDLSMARKQDAAKALLTRMIQSGAFVITDA